MVMNGHWLLFFLILCSVSQLGYASEGPIARPAMHAMVATQEAIASRVGLDILKQGGNAIDAAVAVGFTLAVTSCR
jgi:gamma-glutamyltranspeptidase